MVFKDPLSINTYGIPEPISKKKVNPEILLIPLVAYDGALIDLVMEVVFMIDIYQVYK